MLKFCYFIHQPCTWGVHISMSTTTNAIFLSKAIILQPRSTDISAKSPRSWELVASLISATPDDVSRLAGLGGDVRTARAQQGCCRNGRELGYVHVRAECVIRRQLARSGWLGALTVWHGELEKSKGRGGAGTGLGAFGLQLQPPGYSRPAMISRGGGVMPWLVDAVSWGDKLRVNRSLTRRQRMWAVWA